MTDRRDRTHTWIPIGDVHPSVDNPRSDLGDVDGLAASIRDHGLVEPLIVQPRNGDVGYQLVAGERRLAACRLAGLDEVECIVQPHTDLERRVGFLVENLQREGLSVVDEARGYQQLVADGLSQRDIASRVGVNQSHVSKRLKLLKLPDDVLARVGRDDADGITVELALQLAVLAADSERLGYALEGPRGQGPVPWHVEEQLRNLKRDLTIRKVSKQLQLDGVDHQVIDVDPMDYWKARQPDPPPLLLEHLEGNRVVPDLLEHEQLDCHAVTVILDRGQTDPQVKPVCTMPSAHPLIDHTPTRDSDGGAPVEDPEREAKRAELERAGEGRAALEHQLLEQLDAGELDLEDDELLRHVLLQLLDIAFVDVAHNLVGRRLGVELPPDHEGYPSVVAYAEQGPRELLRAVFATVLQIGSWHGSWVNHWIFNPGSPTRRHLAFLERHGYQSPPAELELIAQADAQLSASHTAEGDAA